MKTMNSKLQKAGFESLTVIAIFLATCFSIKAQGAGFKSRLSHNEPLASTETVKASGQFVYNYGTSAEFKFAAEFLNEESESNLAIEPWMADVSYFEIDEMETEFEEALKLEKWMSEEKLFQIEEEKNQENQMIIIIDRQTKTIAVTFPGVQFGKRTFVLTEMEDEKMELEQWMVDKSLWVRKM